MWDADKAALLDNTAFTQPALFSLEYALARMWQSFGIQPLAAAGHSIGEYVAATLAGVFSLEDAARLVAARGRLIASLPAGGGMSAVLASEKDVLALLAACGTPERTGIAAVNGSTQTVLSGPLEDLARIADKAGSLGISIRHLPVSHAFHSSLMDPILDDFARVAESIAYDAPGLPVVSNVTGRLVGPAEISGADYWVRHIRSTVRFFDGFRTLRDMAPAAWLELGPSGVLTALCRREQALENSGEDGVWVAAMHAGTPEWRQTCEALAALYRSGADVDWAAFAQDPALGPPPPAPLPLPGGTPLGGRLVPRHSQRKHRRPGRLAGRHLAASDPGCRIRLRR